MVDTWHIRPAQIKDADAIARVHVDTWQTAYAGIVPAAFLQRLSYRTSAAAWRQRFDEGGEWFLFVADDDQAGVVGFVSGGRPRNEIAGQPEYRGEVYALYVRTEHQRRGIGSQLMDHAFHWLTERGLRPIFVWVLAENPSARFYESLGGQPVARKTITIGGADLAGIAYAWR